MVVFVGLPLIYACLCKKYKKYKKPQKVNKTKACVMVIMRENVLNCHNTNFAMQKKKKSLSTLCFLYANI